MMYKMMGTVFAVSLLLIPNAAPASMTGIVDNPFIGTWELVTASGCVEHYHFSKDMILYSSSGSEINKRSYRLVSKNANHYSIIIENHRSNGQPSCSGTVAQTEDADMKMHLNAVFDKEQEKFRLYFEMSDEPIPNVFEKLAEDKSEKEFEF